MALVRRDEPASRQLSRVIGMYCMQTYLASNKRPPDLTDDDLVQQAQSGDQDAFAMLVERYSALLFRLSSQLVRDEHLAQDVLQQVFLQLYRSLPTLRQEGTLKAWLLQVARHRCSDELCRRRPLFFSEIASVLDGDECVFLTRLPDPDRRPEKQVELLLAAIELLPPNFRAVVRLRYATQPSFREIGQALSIPAATVKTYFIPGERTAARLA
jgi:RNA polymerase sigma factor (sigma-70 family)